MNNEYDRSHRFFPGGTSPYAADIPGEVGIGVHVKSDRAMAVVLERPTIPESTAGLDVRPTQGAASHPKDVAEPVAVIGHGNSGRALAAWLMSKGHAVRMIVRDTSRVGALRGHRTLRASGGLEGEYRLDGVSDDWSTISQCSTIFVATVTNAYIDVARRLAPHISPCHAVVLFSGKLAGSVEMERALECPDVPVLETDALFACRMQPDDTVWIRGVKGWTLYSASRASGTRQHGHLLTRFFPNLTPAQNVLQRGLTDFGALCHPVTMIANINAIDRKEPFRFYYDGLTDRTVALLEKLESEFQLLARVYGTSLVPMAELLGRYYGCDTSSLRDAMRSVPNYRHSMAPDTLDHRYLTEDVSNTLVPLFQLARKAGVSTPMLDSTVHIASILCGQDLLQCGRTLHRLGWEDMSADEIVEWMAR